MKPLKKHYTYIYFLYIPLFLLALVLVLFFPEQSVLCFRVHWLVLLFTLFLAVSPIGNIRLGEKESAIQFKKWFVIILLTGIALTFIYWGLLYVCFQGLPVQLPENSKDFIRNTGTTLLLTWGVYPWFLFLLIGIGLAYIGFKQKKPGKFSLLLSIIFKSSPDDATSLSTDFITRIIIHFSLATTIGFITLLTIALLSKLFQSPISVGLNFATLLVATILLIGINTPQWQKTVRYFAVKKIPLAILTITFIISAALVILIANYVVQMFVANFPQGNKTLVVFHIPKWETYWQLLSGMWWLSWTPLMTGLIAFLSRGYKVRTVIFGGLLVLVINILVLIGLTQTDVVFNSHWQILNYLLPWIGFVIIGLFFMQKKYLSYQMRAVVPNTQLEKKRSTLLYSNSLLQSAAFIVILYLPLGIYVTSVFIFMMVFPLAIVIAIIFVSLIKLFLGNKKGA